jgi:hypothetical protein
MRCPGRRPRLTFEFRLRWPTQLEAAGRFTHMVKCARIIAPGKLGAATQPHFIRPRWVSTLDLQARPLPVHLVRGCGPLRAYGEVHSHIEPGKLGAAIPTASHPRPSWAADEIECRVRLKLGWFGTETRICISQACPRINPGTSEGHGCVRFGVRGRLRGQGGRSRLTFKHGPRRSMFAGGIGVWRQLSQWPVRLRLASHFRFAGHLSETAAHFRVWGNFSSIT